MSRSNHRRPLRIQRLRTHLLSSTQLYSGGTLPTAARLAGAHQSLARHTKSHRINGMRREASDELSGGASYKKSTHRAPRRWEQWPGSSPEPTARNPSPTPNVSASPRTALRVLVNTRARSSTLNSVNGRQL
jgi:hypothetical protein